MKQKLVKVHVMLSSTELQEEKLKPLNNKGEPKGIHEILSL
jgi:hypothetical protein